MAKISERRLIEINGSLTEILESLIDRFSERDAGDEWTHQDMLFMQDVRELYEEIADG